MFENFKTVNLTIGLPYISITSNGITFSKTAVVKMGAPSHVVLMMNEPEKQIAIQVCDAEKADATAFVRNKDNKTINVRWNNKDFLNTLSKMMGWDLSAQGYRINGDYYSNENAMLFDLKQAIPIGEKDGEEN